METRTPPLQIGILTYHFSDNFGAALQAYALRSWLLSEGHAAEFVNYFPDYVEHGGDFRFPSSGTAMRANVKVAYLRFAALRQRLFGNRGQLAAFEAFRANDLGVRGPDLKHIGDLENDGPGFDLLICGSDQIWNPSVQRGLDPAYFLGFGRADTRRISYAASFGGADLEVLRAAGAKPLLELLDAISVREESGVGFVKQLTGRDAFCVADPTCLPDHYQGLLAGAERPAPEREYVFCYALRTDKGVREAADKTASILGRPLLCPGNPHSRWRPIGRTVHPGPREWVALIEASSFVVTNSFHGTVFSILMGRPFLVAGLPGAKRGLNGRMISFLTRMGLMDRFVAEVTPERVEEIVRRPVDWESVTEKLSAWRESSRTFLRRETAATGGRHDR